MKFTLKIALGLAGILILIVVLVSVKFMNNYSSQFSRPDFSIHEEVIKGDVELGKRIFMVRSGCIECHGANLAGTKVMDDPAMGVIFGANITPYNLKNWSDEEIAGAIRYGIHKEGRSLRFMPSFDFEGLSKSDIGSLIAFLRSVPEVQQPSHQNTFGPLARLLSSLGKMPVMFPAMIINPEKGFSKKPEEAATVSFGKYLSNSCIGCHGAEFKGGKIPGGDPAWPEAANIRLGVDSFWNEEKFREVIASGNSARTGLALRAPMPVSLLRQMNEMEIKALWMYLETLK